MCVGILVFGHISIIIHLLLFILLFIHFIIHYIIIHLIFIYYSFQYRLTCLVVSATFLMPRQNESYLYFSYTFDILGQDFSENFPFSIFFPINTNL